MIVGNYAAINNDVILQIAFSSTHGVLHTNITNVFSTKYFLYILGRY